MGIHFDGLVELVNRGLRDVPKEQQIISEMISKCKLFELDIKASELAAFSGKDLEALNQYTYEYLKASEGEGKFLAMPFDVTAIEDKESVVIFSPAQSHAEYNIVISTRQFDDRLPDGKIDVLNFGTAIFGDIQPGEYQIKSSITLLQNSANSLQYRLGQKTDTELYGGAERDLRQAAVSYIEQTAYLMDPENFIVEKRSSQSRKLEGKTKKLQKSVNRARYMAVYEADLREYLRRETGDPTPFTPIRGTWRTYKHRRFVNWIGQKQFIAQHYHGDPDIPGKQGIFYRVFLKQSLTDIRPASEIRQN